MELKPLGALLFAACITIVPVSAVPHADGSVATRSMTLETTGDANSGVTIDRDVAFDEGVYVDQGIAVNEGTVVDAGVYVDQGVAVDSAVLPKTSLVRSVLPREEDGVQAKPWVLICISPGLTRKCVVNVKLVCDDDGQIRVLFQHEHDILLRQCRDQCECYDVINSVHRSTSNVNTIDSNYWNTLNHAPWIKPY